MKDYFKKIINAIGSEVPTGVLFTCNFSAEESEFCRFNRGSIRQSGSVLQQGVNLCLIKGNRQAKTYQALSRNIENDGKELKRTIASLMDQLSLIPDDPFLHINEKVESSESISASKQLDLKKLCSDVIASTEGKDFVGILAGGQIYRGFANSFGQLNWYQSGTFSLDWSLYVRDDKAVKQSYAGFEWDRSFFEKKLSQGMEQLEIVSKPPRTVKPGAYRCYLAPAAVQELLEIISWGGFGKKSIATKNSSLIKLYDEGQSLSSKVKLVENTKGGLAPNFDDCGFIKPDELVLIDEGKAKGALVAARAAKEFDLASTGATSSEMPEALWLTSGTLPSGEVLKRLGTGFYVNNLWYVNFSDRQSGRLTGMTRFASFWVEDGKIAAPLNVMRFDDSIFNILGDHLEAFTDEAELMFSADTYEQRSTTCFKLPGALVSSINFTL